MVSRLTHLGCKVASAITELSVVLYKPLQILRVVDAIEEIVRLWE